VAGALVLAIKIAGTSCTCMQASPICDWDRLQASTRTRPPSTFFPE